MKLPRLPKTKIAVATAALALVSAGCARTGDAGVGVTNLTADLVFGAKKDQPAAAPANFPSFNAVTSDTFTTTPRTRPTTPTRPVATCPAATVNEFPRGVSESRITSERPSVGVYRWKRAGTFTPANSPAAIQLGGFENHQILNFADASPDPSNAIVDYTFQTSQPDLLAANVTVVTSWHVRHLQGDDPPVNTVRGKQVPRVERAGIFVTKIERREKTAAGDNVSTFTPGGSGVMYLPLPFNIGRSFDSVGVDPKTFETFQNTGTVTKKVQVDACGKVIDTYEVSATQQYTRNRTTLSLSGTYNVATSMGGILVKEASKGTLPDGSKLDSVNTIGQVDPTPATAA